MDHGTESLLQVAALAGIMLVAVLASAGVWRVILAMVSQLSAAVSRGNKRGKS